MTVPGLMSIILYEHFFSKKHFVSLETAQLLLDMKKKFQLLIL